MHNLVLGSNGFVGSPLCRYLESLGESVIEFDIKNEKNQDLRHAKLDLSGVDRVYFLAWDVGGSKYLYDADTQLTQFDWNLALLTNVMPQIKDIPFLFVSSQLSADCDSVYGVQKRLGEVWTRLLNRGVMVRLWNVYGAPEPVSRRSHVVADFVYQALTTGEIRMRTTGQEQRQFIHIDDVCRGFVHAFEVPYGKYDLSPGQWVSILDIAKTISDLTGCRIVPGTNQGASQIVSTTSLPGWQASVSIHEGLSRFIRDCKNGLK